MDATSEMLFSIALVLEQYFAVNIHCVISDPFYSIGTEGSPTDGED